MQRIYYSEKLSASLSFPKTHPIYHQFSRVLRSRIGDRVVFFNGSGQDIVYEIHEISKSNIELVQKNIIEKSPDRLTQISLYQALPNKLEKLEYILQKWVEIGISKFVFFPSERSQPLPLLSRKEWRLRDIAIEALEQCQGDILPEIVFLSNPPSITPGALILHPLGVALSVVKETPGLSYDLWVGPEGGWSEGEMQRYLAAGAKPISLGDRILRTETAGVVVGFYLRG